MKFYPATVWIDQAWRFALVGEPARKFTPVIYTAPPVKIKMIPNHSLKTMGSENASANATAHAAQHMLRKTGKHLGITLKAKRALRDLIVEAREAS